MSAYDPVHVRVAADDASAPDRKHFLEIPVQNQRKWPVFSHRILLPAVIFRKFHGGNIYRSITRYQFIEIPLLFRPATHPTAGLVPSFP